MSGRRRRFPNEISRTGLERVRNLLSLAAAQDRIPTQSLLRAAELQHDPRTGLGGLKMAEVVGLVHSNRGDRKTLLWSGGASDRHAQPQPENRMPFRRLRDLLQYYRGSLIGTPDLIRDTALPNKHEALGALKALVVLGHVEIGHLDPQTVAWRWVSGTSQRRVYQRGFFERSTAPIPFSDAREDEQATVGWNWVDEVAYREWWLRDEHGGFESVAGSDGMQRYRPPTADGTRLVDLVLQACSTMPTLQRVATELIIVRDLSESETAKLLGLARSTVRRLTQQGRAELQAVLTDAGYAPPQRTGQQSATRHQLAQAA
jgi:Sigma-70, region 4